jgi:hypothetical protein
MPRKYDYTPFGKECAQFLIDHNIESFKKMAELAGVKESSFTEARTSDRGYEELRRIVREYMAAVNDSAPFREAVMG